jgi:hypothetical protein
MATRIMASGQVAAPLVVAHQPPPAHQPAEGALDQGKG